MVYRYIWLLISIYLTQAAWATRQHRPMLECHSAGVKCSRWGSCYFDTVKKNFTCNPCVIGYTGDLCEEDLNECERGSAPCLKHGVCHNYIGSFRCDCLPGWKGSHCQHSDGSGLGTCLPGYTGANCTNDFDECTDWTDNPCEHGSTCINVPGNFTCNCATGWEGRICNKDVDECSLRSDLCHNGGNCTNTPGSYTCECPYPYTGPACDDVSPTTTQSITTTKLTTGLPTPSTSTSDITLATNGSLSVDVGNWSIWTDWSNCDITCGNGSKSRTRRLVRPHTGIPQCSSQEREILICELDKCPVNGVWSSWSVWGHCSVDCGIGLERRYRNCSNPYPGPGDNPCFGDSTEDRPCFIRACADGVWSEWSTWGTCSATCLGGIQTRTRACNNPAPSQFGHDCVGNSQDVRQCSNRACQDPSISQAVAFRARTLSNLSPSHDQILVYTVTELNKGDGYDSSVGVFTAPVSGVYLFVVQTCAAARHDFRLAIVKDGHVETSMELYFADGFTCYTTNALVLLITGDKVWVASQTYSSGNVLYEDASHINMFQGTRIGV